MRACASRAGHRRSAVDEQELADDADRAVLGGCCVGVIDLVVDPAVELEQV